jgi:hypothetical protein
LLGGQREPKSSSHFAFCLSLCLHKATADLMPQASLHDASCPGHGLFFGLAPSGASVRSAISLNRDCASSKWTNASPPARLHLVSCPSDQHPPHYTTTIVPCVFERCNIRTGLAKYGNAQGRRRRSGPGISCSADSSPTSAITIFKGVGKLELS